MGKDQATNIREVAALAGVSTATVSRALQHPDQVKPETRERVLAAVERANFVPNSQARSFRQQANRTVILLVRDIGNPFYLEIYKGVEETAGEAGYKVLMGDARNDEVRVRAHIDMVRQKHADGLILMTGQFPADQLVKPDLLPPIVIASETISGIHLPTVKVDNVAASKDAVRYLIAAGHRSIAHLAGPLPEGLASERFEGYRQALADGAIEPSDDLVIRGDYGIEAGRLAVRQMLATGVFFTAIFAASDQMAIGAISELKKHGRAVPKDVSVIGFDDMIFANAYDPPLTTVRQPRREMGRRAMELMVERLSGRTVQGTFELETELVIRGSVAPRKPKRRIAGRVNNEDK